MKFRGIKSKELLSQLGAHKDELFSQDKPQKKWKGLDERHRQTIRMIPVKARRRSMILATGAIGLMIGIPAVSLYIWISDLPQPAPVNPPKQTAEKMDWYTAESDSWATLFDSSEVDNAESTKEKKTTSDVEEILDAIPEVEQSFYIIDTQLQWLAQPQW